MGFKITKPILLFSAFGTGIGGVCLLKLSLGGKSFEGDAKAEGKTIIVTGANSGIGKETTRELARRGAKVVMACRDMKKCEEVRQDIVLKTKNKYVYCRQLDLASQQSVRAFAETFNREFDNLHVLVNNAGVMRCPYSTTKEGIEMQLGVNHMGHFLLTNLLLDKLKASAPSRIVTVSSIAHKRGTINREDLNSNKKYDPGSAYNQSKLANVLFTLELAKRLQGTGVTVNSLHPGIVDTELFRHMGFFKSTVASLIFRPLMWPFVKTPIQGAQTTLYAVLDESLKDVTGKYFSNCDIDEPSEKGKDEIMAFWLWQVSDRWTRLNQRDADKTTIKVKNE